MGRRFKWKVDTHGSGILLFRPGSGYVHDFPENAVRKTFASYQARTGWLRRMEKSNALADTHYLRWRPITENNLTIEAWWDTVG